MIPIAVRLKNFLSYDTLDGEPYVFDFTGNRLWSISGENGAGKSAIFDAITWTLFGEARGGKSNGEDLMRKGTQDMSAEFEFQLDRVSFRVRRQYSVRTGKAGGKTKQALFQVERFFEPQDVWVPEPETDSKGGLQAWVQDKLGFGYETFCASLLLVQGRSDRLILADPKDRFRILSSLLDLEQYKRLEDLASNRVRRWKGEVDVRERDLAAHPEVTDDQMTEAKALIEAASEAAKAADETLGTAKERREAAKRYADQQGSLRESQTHWQGYQEVLANAETIEAAFAELVALRSCLTPLRDAADELRQAQELDSRSQAAAKSLTDIDLDRLQAARREAEDVETKSGTASEKLRQDVTKAREERDRLEPVAKRAAWIVELVTQIEGLRDKLAVVTPALAELPEVEARAARQDALNGAQQVLRELTSARSRQEECEQALRRLGDFASWEDACRVREGKLAQLRARKDEAEKAAEQAQQAAGNVGAEIKQASGILAERQQLGNEGTCSRCGQPVSPEHVAFEIQQAQDRVDALQGTLKEANQHMSEAAARKRQAGDELEQATTALRQLERQQEAADEVSRGVDRWLNELVACPDVPEDILILTRGPVSDARRLPDMVAIELADRQAVARHLTELRQQQTQQEMLAGELRQKEETLGNEESDLPRAERERILKQFEQAKENVKRLEGDEHRLHDAWVKARNQAAEARQQHEEAERERNRLTGEIDRFEGDARTHQKTAEALLRPVRAEWRDRLLSGDIAVVTELALREQELAESEALQQRLETARRESEVERRRIEDLERELEGFPEDQRIAVAEAERLVAEAMSVVELRDRERDNARAAWQDLQKLRRDRDDIQGQLDAALLQRRLWDRLAKLLGRGGLQAQLVMDATHKIGDYANHMLRDISDGLLEMRVALTEKGTGNDKIMIYVTDLASTEEELDIQYISGGQKFRAAVALAAGIGRQAGRGGTGLQSLIVDEGFGSLDERGREDMITALKDLSNHLDRVIVVSHQEDFKDPRIFPAGYNLRKDGQRTVVERLS